MNKLHEVGMELVVFIWEWFCPGEIPSFGLEAKSTFKLGVFNSIDGDSLCDFHVSDCLTIEVVHGRDTLEGDVVHHEVNQGGLSRQE